MTNINCSKACRFQEEGKCSCDSIMISALKNSSGFDADCPYCIPTEEVEAKRP